MALVHETDNAGKTMELVDIEGYRLPTFWKTAEEIKGIFENIPNFSCDDDSLMLCSYPKTGELRQHGMVLLRTFWSANAYFIKNLNSFLKNKHINSLSTLSFSPQESKSGKLKIKTLWPKPRYQWSICYIPINTFSIVKIH